MYKLEQKELDLSNELGSIFLKAIDSIEEAEKPSNQVILHAITKIIFTLFICNKPALEIEDVAEILDSMTTIILSNYSTYLNRKLN